VVELCGGARVGVSAVSRGHVRAKDLGPKAFAHP